MQRSRPQGQRLARHCLAIWFANCLIKVFRHQAAARAQFDSDNAALYGSSYGAQALSGAVQPAILFIGNLVFTGVGLVGGLSVIGG